MPSTNNNTGSLSRKNRNRTATSLIMRNLSELL